MNRLKPYIIINIPVYAVVIRMLIKITNFWFYFTNLMFGEKYTFQFHQNNNCVRGYQCTQLEDAFNLNANHSTHTSGSQPECHEWVTGVPPINTIA